MTITARAVIRERSPRLEQDRTLSGDIEAIADAIERELVIAAVRHHVGDLA